MKKLAQTIGLLTLMLLITSFTTPNEPSGGKKPVVGEFTSGGKKPVVGEFTSGGKKPVVGEYTSGGKKPVVGE